MGDRRAVRLSKLPRDVTQGEVEEALVEFRIHSIDILETKSNRVTSHALVVVARDSGPFLQLIQSLRDKIRRGAVLRGRTNVAVDVLPARDTPVPARRDNARRNPSPSWELAKDFATKFHAHVNSDPSIKARSNDREEVGRIFSTWLNGVDLPPGAPNANRLCSLVMAALRRMRLLRSYRAGDAVITIFAGEGGPGDFPPAADRNEAKMRVLRRRQNLQEDKEGVEVSRPTIGDGVMVLPGQSLDISFEVTSRNPVILRSITIRGPNQKSFAGAGTQIPKQIAQDRTQTFIVTFNSAGIGIYRGTVSFRFQKGRKSFTIARYLTVRSGDSIVQDALKPTSPYKKKKLRPEPKESSPIVLAPRGSGHHSIIYENLKQHRVPLDVKEMAVNKELESILVKPDSDFGKYGEFWQAMLWAQEIQARTDITLYDMEGVSLVREGRLYKLSVPGLAENRPSVLRGDIVIITCRKKRFQGRVTSIRLLEVLLDFDLSFSRHYVANVDRVDVRFTFSRTTFRTNHEGCLMAPDKMGKRMLLPEPTDLPQTPSRSVLRIRWANQNLNHEQKLAVENILWGTARPLPYIIFGPPGTGKTTAVVEAVYQLARLPRRLNILLIAPSNDAADILVSRLASYFPPSDLRRVLAYSRSMDQVANDVKPYCKEGQSDAEQLRDITSARIVVGTVNLCARLSFLGVTRGHFDVLCVDEAGHATEPEAVSVAATLMDFLRDGVEEGQIILAGDPRQLGPIITSELCKKYGMGTSYMERLTGRGVYGRAPDGDGYPPELLTKLVRNYRSHPAIMKLPNELFYDDELIMCGDMLSTHSLARWEHLPKPGFPILFHAVHGENLREASSPSWFNPQEAQQVTDYVHLLVQQTRPSVSPDDIGIITPYARQAQKITTALRISNLGDVKVGSVETFQGQERRVIILSTVRAENDLLTSDMKYNLGFVANEKRFNVAITRAKSLLIVIGHPKVLETDKKCWLPLMKLCKERENWLGQDWDEDDDSSSSSSEDGSGSETDSEATDCVCVSQAVEQEGMGYINREE